MFAVPLCFLSLTELSFRCTFCVFPMFLSSLSVFAYLIFVIRENHGHRHSSKQTWSGGEVRGVRSVLLVLLKCPSGLSPRPASMSGIRSVT